LKGKLTIISHIILSVCMLTAVILGLVETVESNLKYLILIFGFILISYVIYLRLLSIKSIKRTTLTTLLIPIGNIFSLWLGVYALSENEHILIAPLLIAIGLFIGSTLTYSTLRPEKNDT